MCTSGADYADKEKPRLTNIFLQRRRKNLVFLCLAPVVNICLCFCMYFSINLCISLLTSVFLWLALVAMTRVNVCRVEMITYTLPFFRYNLLYYNKRYFE